MLFDLADYESYFGPLRLFKYLSFRCACAMAVAFAIGFFSAPRIIEMLHRIKFGQSFRTKEEVGKLAELHESKKGTPTMGGIIIFASVFVSTILFARLNALVVTALFVYVCLTALGFADDYLKIVKKNPKGISGKLKLAVQGATTVAAVAILCTSADYSQIMRELWIPFMKYPIIACMPLWFMVIFLFFVLAGSSNAINLTDGIDGLAIGCTISATLAYGVFTYVAGNSIAAEYLFLRYIPGSGEMTVVYGVSLVQRTPCRSLYGRYWVARSRGACRDNRIYVASAVYARNSGRGVCHGGHERHYASGVIQNDKEENFFDVSNTPPF